MDGEFPWIYVAMIVIAFVSWIFRRIQEATAARRMRRYEQEMAREQARSAPEGLRRAEPKEPAPTPADDFLKRTYESLGIPFPEETQPPPPAQRAPTEKSRPSPPPLPTQRKRSAQTPSGSTGRVPPSPPRTPPLRRPQPSRTSGALAPVAAPVVDRSHQGGGRARSLRASLKKRDSIQRAILLKEILDTPRALRPHGR